MSRPPSIHENPMSHYRAVAAPAPSTPQRIGVLLVNLGTPDAPSYFAVRRYLRAFLGDRRVIDVSPLLWKPLLHGVILNFRPLRTAAKYRAIWTSEGSPIAVYSQRLAAKVGARLGARLGDGVRVRLAMTYGNPSIAAGIDWFAGQNVRRLVVLPMYPQYCSSTTGSVFDATARVLSRWRWIPETRFVNDYHDDPGYLDALAARIEAQWAANGERSHLLLSYHGIPVEYVAGNDPYQAQAEATTHGVVARLKLAPDQWSHSYQSRFGPVQWLQPYTEDTLRALAGRGVRRLTVISPSFAVDCLETLEEIEMEYRSKFLEFGGEHIEMVPALNDDDRHAELLASVATRHLQGWI